MARDAGPDPDFLVDLRAEPAAGEGAGVDAAAASGEPKLSEAEQWLVDNDVLDYWAARAVCKAHGLAALHDWQKEAILTAVQQESSATPNFVFSAPTGSGKSFVAHVLAHRAHAACDGAKPVLFVLPYVALCEETSARAKIAFGHLEYTVCDSFGSKYASITNETGAVVCTTERADMTIGKLYEQSKLHEQNPSEVLSEALDVYSCIVFDELDIVSSEVRGATLEGLLTKLRYAAPGTKLVGMSATLPNLDVLGAWLGAATYQTTCRAVPQVKFIKDGLAIRRLRENLASDATDLFEDESQNMPLSVPPEGWSTDDVDHTALLVRDYAAQGHGVLVFCGTKALTQTTASLCARLSGVARTCADARDVLEELQLLPGVDQNLVAYMQQGVAYHHAGLGSEERKLVEKAFRAGQIKVLCATSTLAAGVNLPARLVIVRHPWIRQPHERMSGTMFQQMAGRAGRAGLDDLGECILMSSGMEPGRVYDLVLRGAEEVKSQLGSCTGSGADVRYPQIEHLLMQFIAAERRVHMNEVPKFLACSLWGREHLDVTTNSFSPSAEHKGRTALQQLVSLGMIHTDDEFLETTVEGAATLASGLAPKDSFYLKRALDYARVQKLLLNDLHLMYLCSVTLIEPSWDAFGQVVRGLQERELSLAMAMCSDRVQSLNGKPSDKKIIVPCLHLWNALIMMDLIDEKPVDAIMAKYKTGRGDLASLHDRTARRATAVANFCARMGELAPGQKGWHDLKVLITNFQRRVLHAVRDELVEVMGIDQVGASTARQLFSSGLRTVELVAQASVQQVADAMCGDDPRLKRRAELRAPIIIANAKKRLSELAHELRAQANAYESASGRAGRHKLKTSRAVKRAAATPAKRAATGTSQYVAKKVSLQVPSPEQQDKRATAPRV